MLFIVLRPIIAGDIRTVTFIKANSYREVREQLHLPMGWTQWICITEKQLEAIMLSPEHHHSEITPLIR